MKTYQKMFAVLLSITLIFGLFAFPVYAADNSPAVPLDIPELMELYPEGLLSTNTTPQFRISIHGPGYIMSAEGCWGFAILFSCGYFGLDLKASLPATWIEINKAVSKTFQKGTYINARESLQIGDILATVNPSHAMVVIGMDETGVTIAEGNYGGRVHYGRTISYEAIDQKFAYVFRLAHPDTPRTIQCAPGLQESPFDDVTEAKYFYHPVLWAVRNRITAGTSETTFSPDDPCTREQVMTFVWRTSGSPKSDDRAGAFVDIKEKSYYAHAVSWGLSQGITCGVRKGWFGVGEPCSRSQIVTFLWRAHGSPKPATTENPFVDVEPNKYYTQAVLWAVENGITAGKDKSHFGPDDICTRAEVVTFLFRAFADRE